MSLPLEAAATSTGSLRWLKRELAPREGRAMTVAQMSIGCAITVAIAMVFEVPEPTYMAYMVFLISRDERVSTIKTAIGGLAAVTLAVTLTLGLSLFDLGEPALRLPIMAALTFLAMFSVRVSALGPVTFLAGFVIVLLQSVVDVMPRPEPYTRITLWIWLVVLVPVVVTLALNRLLGQSVELLIQREFKRCVRELAEGFDLDNFGERLRHSRETLVQLLDKVAPRPASQILVEVNRGALRELLDLCVLLETAPLEAVKLRGPMWAAELREIGDGVGRARSRSSKAGVTPATTPWDRAIGDLLGRLRSSLLSPDPASPPPPSKSPPRLIGEDAFRNPDHWQFALKTTLAMMIVYSVYTMLDWPGMRTSIVTCFFVALGSLGETIHKLTLRVSGAILGGLTAALCIVFVLPHCTDIGDLCLLIAGVSVAAGWLATSSERLSYAGLQMAFAFFLGVLQGYGPATDLTVLRDRVAGIILGNVVMTLVFSTLWPKSSADHIPQAAADALRALSRLLARIGDGAANRESAARALVRAENLRILRGFEGKLVGGRTTQEIQFRLSCLARLESAVFGATAGADLESMADTDRAALSGWAASSANAAAAGKDWPAVPDIQSSLTWTQQVVLAARRAAVASMKEPRDSLSPTA